jgi:hypothetical protein
LGPEATSTVGVVGCFWSPYRRAKPSGRVPGGLPLTSGGDFGVG